MFGDEALRLLRTIWKNPNTLAQEIYAIFSTSDQSPQTSGPLTISNDGSGNPPITVRGYGSSDLMFKAVPDDGQPFTFVAAPIPSDTPLGTSNLDGSQPTGLYTTPDANQQPTLDEQPKQVGGGGIPGKILSGSGSSYRVQIYGSGLKTSSGTVTATALGLASGESIPSGTWVLLAQAGNDYGFVPPVWLADLEDT